MKIAWQSFVVRQLLTLLEVCLVLALAVLSMTLHCWHDEISSPEEIDIYMDKIEAELKKLFAKKGKEIKERIARQKQLPTGDKQDESDDQSEN